MYVAYLKDKTFLIAFGKHLKQLRLSKNMSQIDLAYECNMEISQISRMERGILNTSISNVFIIAKALNLNHKELFDFEVKKSTKIKL